MGIVVFSKKIKRTKIGAVAGRERCSGLGDL